MIPYKTLRYKSYAPARTNVKVSHSKRAILHALEVWLTAAAFALVSVAHGQLQGLAGESGHARAALKRVRRPCRAIAVMASDQRCVPREKGCTGELHNKRTQSALARMVSRNNHLRCGATCNVRRYVQWLAMLGAERAQLLAVMWRRRRHVKGGVSLHISSCILSLSPKLAQGG